ncbi:MAG: permease [Saprospiraceae bacterium]|nr:MAG: permease [Saprospiraceae bacterium]
MAWRDSRRQRGRLLLFVSSIVIGIAALVAINSFSENLEKDIAREARSLLGADFVVEGNQALPDSLQPLFDSLPVQNRSRTMNLLSMVLFPKNDGTRLVQVRAQWGAFPFYGSFATTPAEAAATFRRLAAEEQPAPHGADRVALVEKTLMLQFGLQVGDSVRVGNLSFLIAGQLDAASGRAGVAGFVVPVVYIPGKYLEATGLVQRGSLIWYQYFYQLPEGTDVEAFVESRVEPLLEPTSLNIETVGDRQEGVSEAFRNMRAFLNLVGFIALLLGCIGVASAVHIYIKDKIASIAVLRCLGVKGWQAFQIYLVQVVALGLGGGLVGALVGSLLQVSLPAVMGDFLPIGDVSNDVSVRAIAGGMLTGLAITVLFALLPLLSIRRISPLRTLRASFEADTERPDPLRWVVFALIFAFVTGFTFWQTGELESLYFPVGVVLAFLALAGVARALMWAVRRWFPREWSYVLRQAVANLYRPNNQTLILIVTIGLGTALISTLFLVKDLLLQQVAYAGAGDVPNMIVFDIQPPQRDAVVELTRRHGLPVRQLVPIVTMRVESVDGITKATNVPDSTSVEEDDSPRRRRFDDDERRPQGRVRNWIFDREFRCTYRDTLIDTETIVEGEWRGTVGPDGVVYISIADNVARAMHAKIGSKVVFNVQGALLETVVGSIRKVDFRRVQTNFLILFPTGVLEQAPQFYVIVSRVDSEEQSAAYQQALVKAFPNVSVIDLTQILESVETVLDKVSFVIRFMAFFSILTGLVVLISSVVLSKYQRVRESVLLRTLGARRRQILLINAVEYFVLGSLACLTGIGLSLMGSWAFAIWVLDIPYTPELLPLVGIFVAISLLTVAIGMANSRDVVSKPPLEVLRQEV